ncbi:hypothetical protein SUBVAR_07072 [Subdoligranulum variabile DSM 15176]|uniref:Uncharacterized protein n=1 Tax=Subdoligranulum variabile DSM 15176 TaxID=411471 RepID=D1PRR3_9FIRM|nr:hypothetical protein SUBVAR_07072 [Subdoligranulum variabile DSM 15176]
MAAVKRHVRAQKTGSSRMRNAAPKIYGFIQENPWFRSNRKDCIFRKNVSEKSL